MDDFTRRGLVVAEGRGLLRMDETAAGARAAWRGMASLDEAADRIAAVAGTAAPTRDSGTVGLNALPAAHRRAILRQEKDQTQIEARLDEEAGGLAVRNALLVARRSVRAATAPRRRRR